MTVKVSTKQDSLSCSHNSYNSYRLDSKIIKEKENKKLERRHYHILRACERILRKEDTIMKAEHQILKRKEKRRKGAQGLTVIPLKSESKYERKIPLEKENKMMKEREIQRPFLSFPFVFREAFDPGYNYYINAIGNKIHIRRK